MRRLLTLATLMMMLGTMFSAETATAQDGSPCDGYGPLDTASGVTLKGGSGSQVLIGSNGPDVLRGDGGHDILCGFGGNDTLVGGPGNDFMDGGAGTDVLRGNSGNDTLANGETNQPGSGNDQFVTIITPFLTVVWTVDTLDDSFSGEITGAGLQPGEPVDITRLNLDGTHGFDPPLGDVQADGTFEHFFGDTSCDFIRSLTFSTLDRNGNPITTDGTVPC